MCAECVKAVEEIFPEVPEEEYGNFLYGTTCFPAGTPEIVRRQLKENRARMATQDWRECYGIADYDLTKAEEEYEKKRDRSGKGSDL